MYFNNTNWHPVADGVIDLEIRVFDQYGNTANTNGAPLGGFYYYPIISTNSFNAYTNVLPNNIELEFGILEPEAIAQARSLSVSPVALQNYLSTNAVPKMEVFRQRVTIAAASR
jgi:hypothetical protein